VEDNSASATRRCRQDMPRTAAVLLLLSLVLLPATAAPRAWHNVDRSKSLKGEFVRRDASSVVIRDGNFRETKIPLGALHADDRAWLDAKHPLASAKGPATTLPLTEGIFDSLAFGDSRKTVQEKLARSRFVVATMPETFFGRTGFNGIYKTRGKIGGLDATLFFGWSQKDELNELSLHSEPISIAEFPTKGRTCIKAFAELLSEIHGKPLSVAEMPDLKSLADAQVIGTHLWKLEPEGSIILGPAREGKRYLVLARYSRASLEPVPKK
jgi:hypothetical protein